MFFYESENTEIYIEFECYEDAIEYCLDNGIDLNEIYEL